MMDPIARYTRDKGQNQWDALATKQLRSKQRYSTTPIWDALYRELAESTKPSATDSHKRIMLYKLVKDINGKPLPKVKGSI